MKYSAKCVKCGGRRLLVINEVREQHEWRKGVALPVHIGDHGQTPQGKYQAFICLQCGFAEWYAYDLESLLRQLPADASIVDGDLPGGPYR